ncbi:hypothetical protein DL96DRAFT_1710875 [Flagelloscypha sp. PMI_526]|nr:hypothetical protein DL96DRAFT_1710875 [Flagelloscypha sp. PMI_526]
MSDASKSLNILSVVGGSDFPSSSPTPTHAIIKPPQPDADDLFDGPSTTHSKYTPGYIPPSPTTTGESSSAAASSFVRTHLAVVAGLGGGIGLIVLALLVTLACWCTRRRKSGKVKQFDTGFEHSD